MFIFFDHFFRLSGKKDTNFPVFGKMTKNRVISFISFTVKLDEINWFNYNIQLIYFIDDPKISVNLLINKEKCQFLLINFK